jgi:hypothetical protein
MYIQKEDTVSTATKNQKAKILEDVDKKKPKKELQGMTYDEQMKNLQPGKTGSATAKEDLVKKSAIEQLKALFKSMDLPEALVPNNVEKFTFDASTGKLTIELKAMFKVKFNEENELTFEKTITGILQKGSLTGIKGIKKGNASITEINRNKPGVFNVTGKLGPFSKTLAFADEDIPAMP